jgi:hypothetical protein
VRHLAFLALLLGFFPGCRCQNAPAEPASVSAPDAGAPSCPSAPEWAEPAPDEAHLLVELLYQLDPDAGRKGTGMRIHDDGRVSAFDELDYRVGPDGKLVGQTIPGMWRPLAPARPGRIDELKALLSSLDAASLADWQGKGRKGPGRPTMITVRTGKAGALRSCYKGQEGSAAQAQVEALTRKIIGEGHDK